MPRYEENQTIEQLHVDVDSLLQRINNAMKIVQEHNAPPLTELCYRLSCALVPEKVCCGHASDCAVHNAPALEVGPCDCGYAPKANYETIGFIAHTADPKRYNREDCCGCVRVEIAGDVAKLVCNECGVELGSGGKVQA